MNSWRNCIYARIIIVNGVKPRSKCIYSHRCPYRHCKSLWTYIKHHITRATSIIILLEIIDLWYLYWISLFDLITLWCSCGQRQNNRFERYWKICRWIWTRCSLSRVLTGCCWWRGASENTHINSVIHLAIVNEYVIDGNMQVPDSSTNVDIAEHWH